VSEDGVFTEAVDFTPTHLVESYVNTMSLHVRKLSELNPDQLYSKFVMKDDVARIDKLAAAIPDDMHERFTIIRSMDDSIEVLHKEASKGRTLKELIDHLGIPRERIMTIGDSGNDIDMVEFGGLGVAMGNAVPEVLAVADVVTSTNNEDGVAKAINRYFFDE
ncbi:MAG TPA: HAD-IIB family hydrolase, partial [Atopostipes sp.]|nr:HAD-IIB family hydrolase [Atopostipes sp.]